MGRNYAISGRDDFAVVLLIEVLKKGKSPVCLHLAFTFSCTL